MPTREQTQTGTELAIAQLRSRIEQRRQGSWLPEPGETARERNSHWREVVPRIVQKIADGEYIGDELLPQLRDDRAMSAMGREFLKAAERGNAAMLSAFIEEGFPANWQDPQTGQAALHVTAATKARGALRILVDSGLCNYLLRDRQGRLASEMAYVYGEDPAVARWLRIHELKQADAQGIKLTRRPGK